MRKPSEFTKDDLFRVAILGTLVAILIILVSEAFKGVSVEEFKSGNCTTRITEHLNGGTSVNVQCHG
jgi:hypothetical protein